MKHQLWLTLLLSAPVLAQISYVPFGRVLHRSGYEIKGTGRGWNSLSAYDQDGKQTKFNNGHKFSMIEGEFLGRYGATDQLQFTVGGVYRQNRATIDDPNSSGKTTELTTDGFQSSFANVQYGFKPLGRMNYTLEGFYRYTPYGNTELKLNDDTTKYFVLGDDGNEYGAGLIVTYAHPSENYFTVRGQYRRPGSQQSPEIYYQAEGALAWRYFALVAGAEGVSSLNGDAYKNDPQNKPRINTGGSALFNSINREYLGPYAGFNLALGETWRLEARYEQVVNARSYDTGSMIIVSLARRVDANPTVMIDKKFKVYDIEASITKVSPKKQYVIIDKGLGSDVRKGQRFDFFYTDYLGGNVLLGTGVVTEVNADQAVVKLTARYSTKYDIKEGTTARGFNR